MSSGWDQLLDWLDRVTKEDADISSESDVAEGVAGEYRLNVRTISGESLVEKRGTFGEDEADEVPEAESPSARDPLVEVQEEDDTVRVVVEVPGVPEDEIDWELHGKTLELKAGAGERVFQKSIELPASVQPPPEITYKNGMYVMLFPESSGDAEHD